MHPGDGLRCARLTRERKLDHSAWRWLGHCESSSPRLRRTATNCTSVTSRGCATALPLVVVAQ